MFRSYAAGRSVANLFGRGSRRSEIAVNMRFLFGEGSGKTAVGTWGGLLWAVLLTVAGAALLIWMFGYAVKLGSITY